MKNENQFVHVHIDQIVGRIELDDKEIGLAVGGRRIDPPGIVHTGCVSPCKSQWLEICEPTWETF